MIPAVTHLRPYQTDAKNAIYLAWSQGFANVLAVLPTGSGKTFLFADIIHDHNGPVCAIAHRQELVSQISLALARDKVRHRIIGPKSVVKLCVNIHMAELGASYYEPGSVVAVAGVDTLVRRGPELAHWLNSVTLWVQDECFPAGTLVDGRPIESIQVGDFVTAYNEDSGGFEQRKVTRLYQNKAPSRLLKVATRSHHVLECTAGHPFLTKRGWVEAIELKSDDEVLVNEMRYLRGEPHWCGLGSVQILEPGDFDGFVYNIEVEGLHTYVAGGVVVHNCHHVLRGNKWGTAAEMFPNAKGLGVTATPLRASGKGLGRHAEGLFDTMYVGPSMRDLINMGYLTEYRVFAPPNDIDLSAVSTSASTHDYSKVQLTKAVRKSHVVGDVVAHYLRIAPGKLGITFATDVETATDMAAAYNAAGVPAAVVSAKTPDAERVALLRKFKNRELLQLVNVDLFGEGFDLPAIEVVSMARPTQSYALYVQQFGRALRPLAGKLEALIIDHVGNVVRHGLPDARQEWTLDARDRKSNGGPSDAIPVRACPACTAVYERINAACPFCGHKAAPAARSGPEQVDGDLIELDAETLAAMRGEVDKIDASLEDFKATLKGKEVYRAELAAKHVPKIGQMAHVKNFAAKQDAEILAHTANQQAQAALRESISWWAGYQRALGRSDSESYRRFFFLFGLDVLSAQALKEAPALDLAGRINTDLASMG